MQRGLSSCNWSSFADDAQITETFKAYCLHVSSLLTFLHVRLIPCAWIFKCASRESILVHCETQHSPTRTCYPGLNKWPFVKRSFENLKKSMLLWLCWLCVAVPVWSLVIWFQRPLKNSQRSPCNEGVMVGSFIISVVCLQSEGIPAPPNDQWSHECGDRKPCL